MEALDRDFGSTMKFGLVHHPTFLLHARDGHVERPERLEAVLEVIKKERFDDRFSMLVPREASDQELLLCHRQEVLDRVRSATASGGGDLDPDTYLNSHSEKAARLAVGGGIDLCRAVLKGEFDRGFVLCRPPGHHATPTRSMGFCLFSTVAIVAMACCDLAERILILDWDVHHGNGTQDCLYHYGHTTFVSFHQSPFYPGTGYADERGEGEGAGRIYNCPLPAGCGDAEYEEAYLSIVRPLMKKYDPELVIVSAGYDAHRSDLLGGMKVSCEGFGRLASLLLEDARACSARGRVVGFLEGGYHLGGLAESFEETLGVWSEVLELQKTTTSECNDRVKRLLRELASSFELG